MAKRGNQNDEASGNYYRIILRPKEEFATFRTHDVGDPGGLQRLSGQRSDGSWDTQAWLISKDYAHVEGNKLVPDHKDAKDLFKKLGAEPRHVKDNAFTLE